MLTENVSRVSIAHLPTPLEALPRLTTHLRKVDVWIKRDDQTGLATGGNKARKLEFLVADALAQEANTLISGGAAQSNHARQTAAAAAKFGLACTLVLRGEEPPVARGNLLLDRLLGAETVWAGERPLDEVMQDVAADLIARGRRPYIVPYGGSNRIGATGYVAAMEELVTQCAKQGVTFDCLVIPSSSGGTQAGLAVGARALGFEGRILGVSIDKPAGVLQELLANLAQAVARWLGVEPDFSPADFDVADGYLGGGYGVVGDLEREAIQMMARTEGILLDPVYTGRAFGGLVDLIHQGAFENGERVLFWHTGGTTGLFGYGEVVL
ncbi:MAG TPA: D-cysteine desulfhydrase family protein [Chloroflexi bacterium]|nr:D-cysteine desulfhydrase family protein [Chloroflexota bacterium]